jgi:regulator of RNase E activity RraA
VHGGRGAGKAVSPNPPQGHLRPSEQIFEIIFGGGIRPGDVIFADCDGVVCVPCGIACDMPLRAEEIRESEKNISGWVASGGTVKEITGKGGCF